MYINDKEIEPMNDKLHRSSSDKMIGGVCGGLGEKLNIDSSLIRLAFVLLFFFGGHGLLIYLILWMIMPLAAAPNVIDGVSHSEPPSSTL
jgi:phage shock protein C